MIRSVFLAIFLLLLSGGAEAACDEHGGYPFTPFGCLHADDLDAAFEGSVGPLPPKNLLNQGAGFMKWWVDTSTGSTTPHARQCVNASGCGVTYVPTDWLDWGIYNTTTQKFTITNAIDYIYAATPAAAIPQNSTVYIGPNGVDLLNSPTGSAALMLKPGVVQGFRCIATTGPVGSQTFTYTLVLNASPQPMTAQLAGAATDTTMISSNQFAVNSGDQIVMRLATSPTAASAQHDCAIQVAH